VEESAPRKKSKIDLEILAQKQREGMTRKEIAKYFGVSTQAIDKATKRVEKAITQAIVFEKPTPQSVAPKVIRATLDSLQILDQAIGDTLELNRDCMAWHRGDQEGIDKMERRKILADAPLEFGSKPNPGADYKLKDPRDLALNAQNTITRQAQAKMDILEKIANAKATIRVMEAFWASLGRRHPDVREEIIADLQKDGVFPSGATNV
jgi:hypothetical protein